MTDIADALEGGVVLLGCGKMGGALLEGWLAGGLSADAVTVIDPAPTPRLEELSAQGLRLNPATPPSARVCILAVKPQMMAEALPRVAAMAGSGTLFVSIAAGTPIRFFDAALGEAAIVRAMPNTPAAVGCGITALIGNARTSDSDLALAETLMSAVGATVRLETEDQMDAVTAVSGSGPAYVFHLIEALAAAGRAEGLPAELSMTLARETVVGAGRLAGESGVPAEELRVNVTSPGGTTAAALGVLMDAEGLTPLMTRAVKAAADRSRELAG